MTDYDNKIILHLNDTFTYKTITHDPTDQFVNIIINELKQLKQNGKNTPQLYNKFPRGSFCPKLYSFKNTEIRYSFKTYRSCTKAPLPILGIDFTQLLNLYCIPKIPIFVIWQI